MALLLVSTRLLNHVGTEVVAFFLTHPYAPAHFAATVCGGLVAADALRRRFRRN